MGCQFLPFSNKSWSIWVLFSLRVASLDEMCLKGVYCLSMQRVGSQFDCRNNKNLPPPQIRKSVCVCWSWTPLISKLGPRIIDLLPRQFACSTVAHPGLLVNNMVEWGQPPCQVLSCLLNSLCLSPGQVWCAQEANGVHGNGGDGGPTHPCCWAQWRDGWWRLRWVPSLPRTLIPHFHCSSPWRK